MCWLCTRILTLILHVQDIHVFLKWIFTLGSCHPTHIKRSIPYILARRTLPSHVVYQFSKNNIETNCHIWKNLFVFRFHFECHSSASHLCFDYSGETIYDYFELRAKFVNKKLLSSRRGGPCKYGTVFSIKVTIICR